MYEHDSIWQILKTYKTILIQLELFKRDVTEKKFHSVFYITNNSFPLQSSYLITFFQRGTPLCMPQSKTCWTALAGMFFPTNLAVWKITLQNTWNINVQNKATHQVRRMKFLTFKIQSAANKMQKATASNISKFMFLACFTSDNWILMTFKEIGKFNHISYIIFF